MIHVLHDSRFCISLISWCEICIKLQYIRRQVNYAVTNKIQIHQGIIGNQHPNKRLPTLTFYRNFLVNKVTFPLKNLA